MKKNYLKYFLDLMMTVLFILLMDTAITGMQPHELLGLSVCGLFVIHNVLNAKWIRTVASKLFDKRFKPLTKFMFILDAVILVDVLMIASSGVLISTELFSFVLTDRLFWVTVHHIAAYGGLILISIHIGLHWKSILGAARKLSGIRSQSRLRTFLLRTLALTIAILGIRSSVGLSFGTKLFPFKSNDTENTAFSDSTPLADSVNAKTETAETEPQTVLLYEQHASGDDSEEEYEFHEEDEEDREEDETFYSGSTNTASSSTGIVASSTLDASNPTLNEYLGSLRCTGCSKHCLLLYPQCSVGVRQAENATQTYNSLYSTAYSTPSSVTTSAIAASSAPTASSDTPAVETATGADIPSLNDYLGSLRCTGCSRHCLLLYPQCSVGVKQAEEATQTYHDLYDEAIAAALSSSTETGSDTATDPAADTQTDAQITDIGAVALFSDYLPVMGLYIGGTYYTIELFGMRKKK